MNGLTRVLDCWLLIRNRLLTPLSSRTCASNKNGCPSCARHSHVSARSPGQRCRARTFFTTKTMHGSLMPRL